MSVYRHWQWRHWWLINGVEKRVGDVSSIVRTRVLGRYFFFIFFYFLSFWEGDWFWKFVNGRVRARGSLINEGYLTVQPHAWESTKYDAFLFFLFCLSKNSIHRPSRKQYSSSTALVIVFFWNVLHISLSCLCTSVSRQWLSHVGLASGNSMGEAPATGGTPIQLVDHEVNDPPVCTNNTFKF